MVLLRISICAFLLLLHWGASSQVELLPNGRHVIVVDERTRSESIYVLPELKTKNAPFIALSIKCSTLDFKKIQYRISQNHDWLALQEDMHVSEEHLSYSTLLFLDPKKGFPQFSFTDPLSSPMEIHLYNPGKTASNNIQYSRLRSDHCECFSTSLFERDSWCDQCPIGGPMMNEDPEIIVIHHSAGANSSSDWAAVVRSIWDFHVNVRGWDDIGYNYLVDPEGKIYTGRGNDRLGAHFCGTNTGTLGICMLGTYSNTLPPQAALSAINSLAAWQSCLWEINPLDTQFHPASGEVLPTVCGHRQGCATECPGQKLFEYLPAIRMDVHSVLNDCDTLNGEETLLQARLTEPFIAELEWDTLPEAARSHILQFKEEGEMSWSSLTLAVSDRFKEIGLKPNTRYIFRIKSIFPLSEMKFSNTVLLETTAWTQDQTDLRLYPNPANELLNVRIVNNHYGPVAYAAFDMNSQKVEEATILKDATYQDFTIESWDLPEGIYVLHISHPDFKYNQKFIIQH